ncbi:orotate phosphoribosyltransferase [Aminirod propionatiphilus]|uniref:Orotate phosphoribosyltransferase n=1 Tax=Aminirod propionatiphilus TaxID=3415223 RepID=A0ACD1DYP1_9BACT|nr:orotate phosphoribosyltransferase [Synergistota bacterium]
MLLRSGAHLKGHFRLTSGLHSADYLQCALLLRYPAYAAFAGEALARHLAPYRPEVVLSPAIGGLIIGHEVARALGLPFLFCEREEGAMRLRRFPHPGPVPFVVVEDVITTGGSSAEVGHLIEEGGGRWVATGSVVDRSGGSHRLFGPLHSLWEASFETWNPEVCPLCRQGTPAVKPGSRT